MILKKTIEELKMLDNKTYAETIVGMMKDYNVTMFDALLWDFESYPFVAGNAEKIFANSGAAILESTFRKYLSANGITSDADKEFYTGIFMGRENNMELKNAQTSTK
jgi:hypothetical protein